MTYKVEFSAHATDDLARLDKAIAQRMLEKILWLSDNFEQLVPEPLGGSFRGLFKLRVGNYRVIYSVSHQDNLIFVHLVGHRREIYT